MLTSTGSCEISLGLRNSLRLKTKRLSPLPRVVLLPRRNVENVDCVVFNLHCICFLQSRKRSLCDKASLYDKSLACWLRKSDWRVRDRYDRWNLHFPCGNDVIQIIMSPHVLFSIQSALVDGPTLQGSKAQLFSKFGNGIGGGIGRMHVDCLGPPIQEEESADYSAESSHGGDFHCRRWVPSAWYLGVLTIVHAPLHELSQLAFQSEVLLQEGDEILVKQLAWLEGYDCQAQ